MTTLFIAIGGGCLFGWCGQLLLIDLTDSRAPFERSTRIALVCGTFSGFAFVVDGLLRAVGA